VVPLDGDASDRRYFRIIPADGPSLVLALHASAIDFSSPTLCKRRQLLQLVAAPGAGGVGHPIRWHSGAADLGMSRCGASRPASPASMPRLYRQAVALIEALSAAARAALGRYIP